MKRHWRPGRIILAILLLSLAALMFYAWPIGPRWRIRAEQPLGFDLKRGLLFTANNKIEQSDDQGILHGYDLVTGERLVIKQASPDVLVQDKWLSWQAVLSADGSTMASSDSHSSIQVYDVRNECRQIFKAYPHGIIESIGLSSNGELLAYLIGNDLKVWDCKTSTIKYRLNLSNRMNSDYSGKGTFGLRPELIQFSADGRYLAAGSDEGAIAVFDMATGSVIGHCPDARVPHFLPDSRTLIAMPTIFNSGKVQWYQLNGEMLKPMPLSRQLEPEREELLAAGPMYLWTFGWDNGPRGELPKWIPAMVREKLEAALGWTNHQWFIKSTNTITGQVREECTLRVHGVHSAKVSPDGLLLAIEENDYLSLWDIPPRRSATCWLVCCSIGLLALFLAWPQRPRFSTLPRHNR